MAPLRPYTLRCEHLTTARGLNTASPRFSWALAGDGHGRRQTAYRIVVENTDGGLLWDSGRVESDQTQLVRYAGPVLPRDEVLKWRVTVWDEAGLPSEPVEPATIFTGLGESDWEAQWIARYFVLPLGREAPTDTIYDNKWQARPADYLRRDFTSPELPVRATLYVSALGLYEVHINGQRVGDDVMAPGWTDYHRRVEYQVHDVTQLVRAGDNVIGAVIGEGWYSGRVGHNQRRAGNHYGGRPALLCQLHLRYADGHGAVVATDDQWQTRQGPICYSDFLMGEMYDARLELPGWADRKGPLEGWQPVETFVPDPRAPQLDAARAQPAREVAVLPGHFSHRTASGAALYDFGQNFAGYVRLTVRGRAGDRYTMRHGEVLDGGELYVANLRHAVATDIFISAGGDREVFKPRFTFHGFRYVELSLPDDVSLDDVTLEGIGIQTDAPLAGSISTGNAMVNQLLSNIQWSQRSNFLAVPTDCPQRDERYGWTADAQVFWKTAGYFMDVSAFLTKWMLDIEDGQSLDGAFPDVAPTKPLNPYRLTPQPGAPGWGDGPIIMAWEHWLRYGDRDLLERFWPAFEKWMTYIERPNPDFIRRNALNNNYGDWLNVGPATDRVLIATAYWVRVADLMDKIGKVIGRKLESDRYAALATRIRASFVSAFVRPDGRLTSDTQTAHLLALDFRLLDGHAANIAADRLAELLEQAGGHLQTGFLGVRHICPVLSAIGRDDLAVALLLKDDYPSWGFSIRHGATTIWERWDGCTPERGFQSANMNSFNHYAYGSVGEWIWARLAGIDTRTTSDNRRVLHLSPLFDAAIGSCNARYEGPTGLIESAWRMIGDSAQWQFAIPPSTTASVTFPRGWRAVAGDVDAGSSEVASGRYAIDFVRR